MLYAGTLGLVAAPLYLLGGQSMIRAGYVTAGCMAGLHGVAKAAPKNAFINWEGPLIIGMNAVLISFLSMVILQIILIAKLNANSFKVDDLLIV